MSDMTPITYNTSAVSAAYNYAAIPKYVTNQIKNSTKLQESIKECLTLEPDDLSTLTLSQMDRYLLLLPKALIWLQDCENDAQNALDDARDAYEDTIGYKASLLPKSQFDTSQVSEKMRVAKIREMFPSEFEIRVAEVRKRERMLTKLRNQSKHVERLNDNMKKIRDSFVVKIRSDKEE